MHHFLQIAKNSLDFLILLSYIASPYSRHRTARFQHKIIGGQTNIDLSAFCVWTSEPITKIYRFVRLWSLKGL